MVSPEERLLGAVMRDNVEEVKKLLSHSESEPKINTEKVTDGWRNTALNIAARGTKFHITKLLVEYGANINTQNVFKSTPLIRATKYGYIKHVKYLLKHNANVNTADDKGKTALHHAIDYRSISKVSYLLTFKANVNATDNKGETPLHLAQLLDKPVQETIINLLLINNANPNIPDKNGETAFFRAVQYGNFTSVQQMLKYKANINQPDNSGKTPLMCAVTRSNPIAIYLLNNGADLTAKDKRGKTAFDYAKESHNHEMMRSLAIFWAQHKKDISVEEILNLQKTNPDFLQELISSNALLQILTHQSYAHQIDVYKVTKNLFPQKNRASFEKLIRNNRLQNQID